MVKGKDPRDASWNVPATTPNISTPPVLIAPPDSPELAGTGEVLRDFDGRQDDELPDHQVSQLSAPEIVGGGEARSRSWPPAPRAPALANLQKSIETFQRRLKRLDAEREQAMLTYMELKFLRDTYQKQHKFVDESQLSFVNHVEHMIQTNDFNTTRGELFSRYGKARGDYHDLKTQSTSLQSLEDQLYSLEESIRQREQTLAGTSEKLLWWLQHLNPDSRDVEENQGMSYAAGDLTENFSLDQDSAPATAASSEGDPLLEHYFDSAGWVKVYRRRLNEVLKEHEERRVQRMQLEDQGNDLLPPEAEFEQACTEERTAAETAIKDAINRRDHAWHECIRHGINPDDHRNATSDTLIAPPDEVVIPNGLINQPSDVELGLTFESTNDIPVTFLKTGPQGEIILAADDDSPDPGQTTSNVEQWIESVEEPPLPPMLGRLGENNNTPRRRSSPTPSRRSPTALHVTEQDKEYLLRHGGTDIFSRLGLELPISHQRNVKPETRNARSANMSDHSRSSSESRISVLLKSNLSQDELKAQLLDARGRRFPR